MVYSKPAKSFLSSLVFMFYSADGLTKLIFRSTRLEMVRAPTVASWSRIAHIQCVDVLLAMTTLCIYNVYTLQEYSHGRSDSKMGQ